MTSIRTLAEKVLRDRAQSGCFMFHALGGETVKHGPKSVVEQGLEVFHAQDHPETLKQPVSDVTRPAVSAVSQPETGAKQQGHGQHIPAPYRAAFAALCSTCPVGVPEPRWRQAIADAERFLAEWGETAPKLGWSARDLFDLHETVPLSRMDRMGLCWLLKGQRVTLITETVARFEGGLAYYRQLANTRAAP